MCIYIFEDTSCFFCLFYYPEGPLIFLFPLAISTNSSLVYRQSSCRDQNAKNQFHWTTIRAQQGCSFMGLDRCPVGLKYHIGGSGGTQDTLARERGVMKGCAFRSKSEVGTRDRTGTMKVRSSMAGHVRKLMKTGEAGLLRGSFTQILKTTRG